ncbi:hypothetical protein Tco_0337743 [Tanacetum coccineum]
MNTAADDSLILSQSSSRHSNLEVGQISHRSGIVLAFLKELIYKVLGIQVPLLELDRFRILLGQREEGQAWQVTDPTGSNNLPVAGALVSFSAVLSQISHLVSSITLNNARPCVMESAFLTQRKAARISTIFSWSGSISPEGFLPSVLLWLVIIVAVVGVGVMVVVVIIVAVVVVESSSVVKLSFVITD